MYRSRVRTGGRRSASGAVVSRAVVSGAVVADMQSPERREPLRVADAMTGLHDDATTEIFAQGGSKAVR